MHHQSEAVRHPGVYHPMFLTAPRSPVHQVWFEETCARVDALIRWTKAPREAWPYISLAVHLVADCIFAADATDPGWDTFDVAAFIDDHGDVLLASDASVPLFAGALYSMLVDNGDIDLDIAVPILVALQALSERATSLRPRAVRRAEAAANRRGAGRRRRQRRRDSPQ